MRPIDALRVGAHSLLRIIFYIQIKSLVIVERQSKQKAQSKRRKNKDIFLIAFVSSSSSSFIYAFEAWIVFLKISETLIFVGFLYRFVSQRMKNMSSPPCMEQTIVLWVSGGGEEGRHLSRQCIIIALNLEITPQSSAYCYYHLAEKRVSSLCHHCSKFTVIGMSSRRRCFVWESTSMYWLLFPTLSYHNYPQHAPIL